MPALRVHRTSYFFSIQTVRHPSCIRAASLKLVAGYHANHREGFRQRLPESPELCQRAVLGDVGSYAVQGVPVSVLPAAELQPVRSGQALPGSGAQSSRYPAGPFAIPFLSQAVQVRRATRTRIP